ncbi:MAG TPA: hypothetical protein VF493_05170 [Terriglobales bacterium]
MIFAFPLLLFLLVLWMLTVLAWVEGFRAIRAAGEPQSGIRGRVLPPLILLMVPLAALVFLFLLRLRLDLRHATYYLLPGRMFFVALVSALAALLMSLRAPRGVRGLALSASVAWLIGLGLLMTLISGLSGLVR